MSWVRYKHFAFAVKILEDKVLVYHEGSGETHCLDNNVYKLLELVASLDKPESDETILRHCFNQGMEYFNLSTLKDALQELALHDLVQMV